MNLTDEVDFVYLLMLLHVNCWFRLNFPFIGTPLCYSHLRG